MDLALKLLPLVAAMGSVAVVIVGLLAWLLKKAYDIAALVTEFRVTVAAHAKLHDQHTEQAGDHDRRLRDVEVRIGKHSTQLEAL